MKLLRSFLLTVVMMACAARGADPIPSSRRVTWTPGTTVGVVGGIPTYSGTIFDVTTYGADPTGVADSWQAFTDAMAAAAAVESQAIVYIPAGTFRINDFNLVWANTVDNVLIKGAGMNQSVVKFYTVATARAMGGGVETEYPYDYSAEGTTITAGITKDTTDITVGSVAGLSIGDLITITELNNPAVPVLNVTWAVAQGQDRMRRQISRIDNIVGNVLTIFPGLFWTMEAGLTPKIRRVADFKTGLGFEDFTIDLTEAALATGLKLNQCVNSWAKGVKIVSVNNYGMYFQDCWMVEMKKCYVGTAKSTVLSNHAGVLPIGTTGLLMIHNIVDHNFPHVEVNFATSGSAFAYNFLHNNESAGVMACSLNINHGAHNQFNIYEGNITSKIQSDGYFGGESASTIFRNWVHATNDSTDVWGIAIFLNRFSRDANIAGNVLGRPGIAGGYVYETPLPSFTSANRYIYSFGFPYILGENSYGTAQLSVGQPWEAWGGQVMTYQGDGFYDSGTAYISTAMARNLVYHVSGAGVYWSARDEAKSGTTTWEAPDYSAWELGMSSWALMGPIGWVENDLDVKASAIIKGNYNFADNEIPPSEALGGDTLVDSYLYASKPSEFGSLTWPPFNPLVTPTPQYTDIPAGYFYVNGTWPDDVGSVWTATTVNVTNVNKI